MPPAGPADEPAPGFLAIGHATRDLLPGGGWRLGGTVTFAALTAQRLGMRQVSVVTSGPEDVLAALREALPGIAIAGVSAAEATTYENIYTPAGRRQYLRGRATPLSLDDVPAAWRSARVALLAPLAHEVEPELATAFPEALVAATPQGWLRRFGPDGLVRSGPLDVVDRLPSNLRALILSIEDLNAPGVDSVEAGDAGWLDAALEQARRWTERVQLVVITLGPEGAVLLTAGAPDERMAGYPIAEVDPTGAGDVFAAAFLCELEATGDARASVDFANKVAALSVEGVGWGRIPTRAEVAARFGR